MGCRVSWSYKVAIVVPASALQAAELLASSVEPDLSCTGPHFLTELSGDGQRPASHRTLCTLATDEMVATMSAALPTLHGVMFWRWSDEGLQNSNVTPVSGQSWSFEASLNAAGLCTIQSVTPCPSCPH
jgi:hypothetical protein